jgi:hypothetical protein
MFIKPAIPASQYNPFNTEDFIKANNLQRFAIETTTQNDMEYALDTLLISNQKGYADAMKQLADQFKQAK